MRNSSDSIAVSDNQSELEPFYEGDSYDKKKRSGASYTPHNLAVFIAANITKNLKFEKSQPIRILDPAMGDGELLLAIAESLLSVGYTSIIIVGFETDRDALELAKSRLSRFHKDIVVEMFHEDFLEHVLDNYSNGSGQNDLFFTTLKNKFDVVIANPPYVRTQVLGSDKSLKLADQFKLSGRVDLYHAFVLAISEILHDNGILGIIISNRFMTTKSGAVTRECFLSNYMLIKIWDMGDTKLFDEAVLPAVIVGKRTNEGSRNNPIPFVSTYSCVENHKTNIIYSDVLDALSDETDGEILVGDKSFCIKNGILEHGDSSSNVWRLSNQVSEDWLNTVVKHRYCCFRDIGKIRVGIKSTADKVFIRRDWESLPKNERPEDEVLLPLITHKISRRWKCLSSENNTKILYTNKVVDGKRCAINLEDYPRAAIYLQKNHETLDNRNYVKKSGRQWYEIWVPHNPDSWRLPKLVFRDIAEHSEFFVDLDGSTVNGDCYWLAVESQDNVDLLWLALAVGNSTFVLDFYDNKFHNKLYSNRRRFMTQYVDEFPIPDPESKEGRSIIQLCKKIYELVDDENNEDISKLEKRLDEKVWASFGLVKE